MLQVTGNKNTEEKYCSVIYLERGQHGECSLQSKKKDLCPQTRQKGRSQEFQPISTHSSKWQERGTLGANGKAGNWSQCSLSLPSLAHLYLRARGTSQFKRAHGTFVPKEPPRKRERERKERERGSFWSFSSSLSLSPARSFSTS